jgi:hypothetical protein
MPLDKEKEPKLGFSFKLEWLLTSIIAGGMTVFSAIRLFEAPLWVAVLAGMIVALADVAVLAWLEWSPHVKRAERK